MSEQKPDEATDAGATETGGRARILVVDDDSVQRGVIKLICGRIGFDPVTAAGYEEAEALLMGERFDCITLDLSLGERDGVEVLQLLARLKCDTPVVIISGREERVLKATVDAARALGVSVAEALPKPLDLGVLRHVLLPFGARAGVAAMNAVIEGWRDVGLPHSNEAEKKAS